MNIILGKWQKQLEDHFSSLAKEKVSHGHFVYAIEHGLESTDVDILKVELSKHLAERRRLDSEYCIVWVVVAAEMGYQYDGDEYWATFSKAIPAWAKFGDREKIRSWFYDFAQRFHGFRPSGRWAKHFKNIAWPIGHSILSRYLQTLFVTHLHNLRFELAASNELTQEQVGKLLYRRYDGGSSRFEDLLEQIDLTGRLVLALRDEDIQDAGAPINKTTLSRILSDLEALQSNRFRIEDTQRVLREARIRAARNITSEQKSAGEVAKTSTASKRPLAVRLIARRLSDASWKLGVALPDLTAELAKADITQSTLDRVRIRTFDQPNYWTPGRNFLNYCYGRDQALTHLPDPVNSPLLVLERQLSPVSDFISKYLRISGTGPWVLRVHGDGVARQVVGQQVHTYAIYLIVTQSPIDSNIIQSLELERDLSRTERTFVYRLNTHHALTSNQLEALRKLHIGYALRARIDPIGLVPRWEDGENSSIWLTTEVPIFQLSSDFPINKYMISVDGAEAMNIPVAKGEKTIIAIQGLDIGPHKVSVLVESSSLSHEVQPETLQFLVRVPRPWMSDITKKAGFRVTLDPVDAPLDKLLDGRAMLSIIGPVNRIVQVYVGFSNISGHILEQINIGRLILPTDKYSIHRLISKLKDDSINEKIESAPNVELSFSIDELGVTRISFQPKVQPLRWKLEKRLGSYHVRLVDEAGLDEAIKVYCCSISSPVNIIKVNVEECLKGILVVSPGALYIARLNKHNFPIIVSVPEKEKLNNFEDLDVPVSFELSTKNVGRIPQLLSYYRNWRSAKSLGPLGRVRKEKVLRAFENHICEIFCGSEWVNSVRKLQQDGNHEILKRLSQKVGGSPGFGVLIRSTDWSKYSEFKDLKIEFVQLVNRYKVCSDDRLTKIALRFAFRLQSIRFDSPDTASKLLNKLAQNRQLARGAYLTKQVYDLTLRDNLVIGSKHDRN